LYWLVNSFELVQNELKTWIKSGVRFEVGGNMFDDKIVGPLQCQTSFTHEKCVCALYVVLPASAFNVHLLMWLCFGD
jgi:hypothetical protein